MHEDSQKVRDLCNEDDKAIEMALSFASSVDGNGETRSTIYSFVRLKRMSVGTRLDSDYVLIELSDGSIVSTVIIKNSASQNLPIAFFKNESISELTNVMENNEKSELANLIDYVSVPLIPDTVVKVPDAPEDPPITNDTVD